MTSIQEQSVKQWKWKYWFSIKENMCDILERYQKKRGKQVGVIQLEELIYKEWICHLGWNIELHTIILKNIN